MRTVQHDDNPSDEGYVEQGFEAPAYMKHWTHEQKAGECWPSPGSQTFISY
jgi:hypothetical protein